jgi:hypothetical protein
MHSHVKSSCDRAGYGVMTHKDMGAGERRTDHLSEEREDTHFSKESCREEDVNGGVGVLVKLLNALIHRFLMPPLPPEPLDDELLRSL